MLIGPEGDPFTTAAGYLSFVAEIARHGKITDDLKPPFIPIPEAAKIQEQWLVVATGFVQRCMDILLDPQVAEFLPELVSPEIVAGHTFDLKPEGATSIELHRRNDGTVELNFIFGTRYSYDPDKVKDELEKRYPTQEGNKPWRIWKTDFSGYHVMGKRQLQAADLSGLDDEEYLSRFSIGVSNIAKKMCGRIAMKLSMTEEERPRVIGLIETLQKATALLEQARK